MNAYPLQGPGISGLSLFISMLAFIPDMWHYVQVPLQGGLADDDRYHILSLSGRVPGEA